MSQNTVTTDKEMISNRKVMFFSFILTITAFAGVFMLEPFISKSLLVPLAGITLFSIGGYALYRMISSMFNAMQSAMDMAAASQNSSTDGTRLNFDKK